MICFVGKAKKQTISLYIKVLADSRIFSPTSVGGGRKMAITTKINDPNELKLLDFSYISMTNPPIPFLAKKGGFRAFLLSAVPISRS